MPQDIEKVFSSVGLDIFPATADELTMDCTCPDWSVPCKHLAAVCHLLAESFDDDPFGILAWRERERANLLDTLAALRTGTHPADRAETAATAVPLTDCLDLFYAEQAQIPQHTAESTPGGAVLDQVPTVDASIRGTALVDVLRPAYLRLTEPEGETAHGTLSALSPPARPTHRRR